MVEARYTLSREALSLKNRHMVKCYPSFDEHENAVKDFFTKLRYYKKLAEKQGKLVDFLSENYGDPDDDCEKDNVLEISPNIRSLTRATITQRGKDLRNLPKIDSESWLRRTIPESERFEYKAKPPHQGLKFDSLHESTLYIDHFC